jgi:putative ABC transport system permease protein
VFKLTRRSLWEHKRRLISTLVAVVLGVAFMAGTFVFADTIDHSFDDLFNTLNKEVDAQVQGAKTFTTDTGESNRLPLDEKLVAVVGKVDGVRAVDGGLGQVGFGSNNRILGSDGKAIGPTQGPPTLIESWIADDLLNPYELVGDGRPPSKDDEIVLNVAAAEEGGYTIGDKVTVITHLGDQDRFTLVGTVRFGTADSSLGAVSGEFTLRTAQRLTGLVGRVTTISAAAVDGVSQAELVARIKPVLPKGAEVLTGKAASKQQANEIQANFAFFRYILGVFGLIALLVGTFVISNTFSILVAQRTRELALLRAIGASRTQVLGAVLVEALLIGLTAGVLGLLGGIGLAVGVRSLLNALGTDMPSSGLIVGSSTVIFALVVGLVVTVLAALVPAIRATRVSPLAAIREVAIDRSGASRGRAIFGVVVVTLAAFYLSKSWTSGGKSSSLPSVGLGAVLAIIGAIAIGPLLAAPTVRVLGRWLPRFRGVTGRLAVENAARSPRRTSATASALMIGVALIGFINVFASSAKSSFSKSVDRGLKADLIVQSGGFGGPGGFSPQVAKRIAKIDGVDAVTSVAFTAGKVRYPDGKEPTLFITAVEPKLISAGIDLGMAQGKITDLTDRGIVLDRDAAKSHAVTIGDSLTVRTPTGGEAVFRVQALSNDDTILGQATITRAALEPLVTQQLDGMVLVTVADSADLETVKAAANKAIAKFPALDVQDKQEFIGSLSGQFDIILNLFQALLFLSIIIAMIGVANTISLSIYERTRELGLLRAVGMIRPQLRSAVRWEAVIVSVLGALVGLGLGLGVSFAVVHALSSDGLTEFTIPFTTIVVYLVIAAGLGVTASILPARRAAKLDILAAIATE